MDENSEAQDIVSEILKLFKSLPGTPPLWLQCTVSGPWVRKPKGNMAFLKVHKQN